MFISSVIFDGEERRPFFEIATVVAVDTDGYLHIFDGVVEKSIIFIRVVGA
jgi:hypothetical protein